MSQCKRYQNVAALTVIETKQEKGFAVSVAQAIQGHATTYIDNLLVQAHFQDKYLPSQEVRVHSLHPQ